MTNLLAGLVSLLLATNPVSAATNFVARQTGITIPAVDPNDPVERELQRLMAEDDAAQAEVDGWIQESSKFSEQGEGLGGNLRPRILDRFDRVRRGYEALIQQHPNHPRVRMAFAGLLSDLNEDDAAAAQWDKVRELQPDNAAVWNNLGTYHSHSGSPRKAIEYFQKAIELAPRESLYHHNLAIMIYMFRKDAMEFYEIDEARLMKKTMAEYHKALALDPGNFPLASELAQTYYGFKPRLEDDPIAQQRAEREHYNDAIAAWLHAFKLARDDIEREGVRLHLARVQMMAGRYAEAQQQLGFVSNPMYRDLKARLERNLAARQQGLTNAPRALFSDSLGLKPLVPAPAPSADARMTNEARPKAE